MGGRKQFVQIQIIMIPNTHERVSVCETCAFEVSIKEKIVVSEIRTTLLQGCGQVLNLFQHFDVNVKYQQAKYISLHLLCSLSQPLGKACGDPSELSFMPALEADITTICDLLVL